MNVRFSQRHLASCPTLRSHLSVLRIRVAISGFGFRIMSMITMDWGTGPETELRKRERNRSGKLMRPHLLR